MRNCNMGIMKKPISDRLSQIFIYYTFFKSLPRFFRSLLIPTRNFFSRFAPIKTRSFFRAKARPIFKSVPRERRDFSKENATVLYTISEFSHDEEAESRRGLRFSRNVRAITGFNTRKAPLSKRSNIICIFYVRY